MNPDEAAQEWEFTKNGKLVWNSIDEMSFQDRIRKRPEDGFIKKWVKSKTTGILLEVNDEHWVVGYYWGFRGLYAIDPLTAKRILVKDHYNITGAAIFMANGS